MSNISMNNNKSTYINNNNIFKNNSQTENKNLSSDNLNNANTNSDMQSNNTDRFIPGFDNEYLNYALGSNYAAFDDTNNLLNSYDKLSNDVDNINEYVEELKKRSEQMKQLYKVKPNIDLNHIVQLSSRLSRATNISGVKSVMSSASRSRAYYNSIVSKCDSSDKQLAKSAATQVGRVIMQGRRKISQLNKEQVLESRKKAAIKENRLRKARALSRQKKDSMVKRKAVESAHVACAQSWALTTSYTYKNSLSQANKQANVIGNLSNKLSADISKYKQFGISQNNTVVDEKSEALLETDNNINAYISAGTSSEFTKVIPAEGNVESVQSQQILNTGIVIL